MLVAVSGGADSVALLCALTEIRDEFDLDLRVIHVNHKLRESATADAEWVQVLCASHSVSCAIEELAWTEKNQPGPVSEDTARTARYNVFTKVAGLTDARWLATAHTADDQAETVLHHILRGTSWRGLRGIPADRPLTDNCTLVRPFLHLTRREIEDYLSEVNQGFRTDETNLKTHYTRNRLRSRILPVLRDEYGAQVDDSLRRLGHHAAELVDFIDQQARRLLQEVTLERTPQQVRVACSPLQEQSPVLVREMCVILWEIQDWHRQPMTSRHWNLLAELLQGETGRKESLPGEVMVERRGGLVVLTQRAR